MSAAEADRRLLEIEAQRRIALGLPPRGVTRAPQPDTVDLTGGADSNPGGDMDIGMLANLAIEYIKYNKDVSELYSPPRVCQTALKVGLDAGTSFDLTEVDPYDNKPWDFCLQEKRDRARDRINKEKPFLLIGSPPCRAFNSLFRTNISRMDPKQVSAIIDEGKRHIEFCLELYQLQMNEGRLFLHEHPLSASSWKLPGVISLLQRTGVYKVRGDMCSQNMVITDREGPAKAYKPTGWMSNSIHILNELNRLCTNNGGPHDHRHANLQNGRAAKAAVYPEKTMS